jgi:general secretion pathway protein H
MLPVVTDRARRQRGVTLIEIMLVVALVGIIAGGVIFGSGVLGSSQRRAAATLVLAGVRQGLTLANSQGLPVRMVFDIDGRRIWLEQTRSRMLRSKADEDEDDLTGGAAAATDAERLAKEEAERILEGPREPPPTFSPVDALGVDPDDPSPGRALDGDVLIKKVHTEHDPAPRTEGRAYLYFWPGGGTEKAVITLARPDDEEPLNVVVSALTGRARIVKGEVDFERPDLDVDFGEREVE